ncbi:hypothetical protein JCM11641_008139 [Rhodosporidiobolus odoratus]
MHMSAFTSEDDLALRSALEKGDGKLSWTQISKNAFPDGRYSKQDCVDRWKIISKPKPTKGPWTSSEDEQLRGLVTRYGSEKWVMIAGEMQTRSGKQCRERWHNHLDPSINKSDWTADEIALIRQLHATIGPRWAEMAKHLPGRPDNSIKNQWMQAREKRERSRSTSSMATFAPMDKTKVIKAKSAAAAAAAVTAQVQAASDSGSPAPGMSRSASSTSLNNARFAPYGRSSPMTKTRSDSASSLSAFSSLRSSDSVETLDSSPYTPSSMAKSSSMSAFGAAHDRLPRYPSMHAPPRELASSLVDPGDATEVLSSSYLPHNASFAAPHPYRRPHANSNPVLPTGLHAWAQSGTPSPPTSRSAVFQPMGHAVEVADAWHPAQQDALFSHQPMMVTSTGRVQPLLAPLQIGTEVSTPGPRSGYDSYEASPQVSYYDDSRFCSPVDMMDPQQHHFLGGAGPLAFDHRIIQQSFGEALPQLPPLAPSAGFGSSGVPSGTSAPYVHPQHLATLDEQHVYEGYAAPIEQAHVQPNEGAVDESLRQIVSSGCNGDGSNAGSSAPSPHDSGYEHSHHSSFDISHRHGHSGSIDLSAGFDSNPAGGLVYSSQPQQGEPLYYLSAHPVELSHDEQGARPNFSRRDTAPPAACYSNGPSPAPFSPIEAPFRPGQGGAIPSVPTASANLHRHTPSLPNPPSYSGSFDSSGACLLPPLPTGSHSASIPSSATFPRSSSHGRPRAFTHATLPSSRRFFSSLSGPSLGAPIDLAAPLGNEPAYIASSQAPQLAGLGLTSLASEPMSKIYSSPMSEIAGRWGDFSLSHAPSPSASGTGSGSTGSQPASPAPGWLPRSAAAVSLEELAAEEKAKLDAEAQTYGGTPMAMFAARQVVQRDGTPGTAGLSAASRPALSRSASAHSVEYGAGATVGLDIDESGRAVLPL